MPPDHVHRHATSARLQDIYARLLAHFGPTGWWPGDSPFEIAVGAILTQNTSWTNVERAIFNLKREQMLTAQAMLDAPVEALELAIRPSGYFRQKAQKLRRFCEWLFARYDGEMARMAAEPLETLRPALLAINGIGPETADDILLYACGKPVFVVDAYTRRIFSRHGLVDARIGYEQLRALFETRLPEEVAVFQEYHGLIVYTAKDFCRSAPRCEGCPLQPLLPRRGPVL